ncbi:MAG TPA: hypothetical protein PK788_08250 [Gemmatimonadaceae bacterium]|nr:hypothetical protein [Gemmatimonadaceae bacterium]HRQ77365.1 hypothetical protein [Gemmatimonadaceae bacterium]
MNLITSDAHDKPMATIWMNRVQPGLAHSSPVFQTWNPIVAPREESIRAQARFERPLVNAASLEGARTVRVLHAQHGRRLWLCGSYLGPGIPLLEAASRTALDVAIAINDDERTTLRLPTPLSRPA